MLDAGIDDRGIVPRLEECNSEIEYFYLAKDWKNFELKLNGLIGWICREVFPDVRQRSDSYKDIQSAARVKVICCLLGDKPYDSSKGTFITFLYSLIKNELIMRIYYINKDRRFLSDADSEDVPDNHNSRQYRKFMTFILDELHVDQDKRPDAVSYFLDRKKDCKDKILLRTMAWVLYVTKFPEVSIS